MRRAAVIALLLLAGCLSDGGGEDDGAPGDDATGPAEIRSPAHCDLANAIVNGHNHADASLHTAFCDMDLVGHTFMDDAAETGTLGGGFIDASISDDGYAFVSNWGPGRSMSIVDVRDPAAPRHVSDFWAYPLLAGTQAGAASHWDISSFPEGDLVVLPSQASAGSDAIGEGSEASGGGLFLVNVEDKESPYLESFTPVFDDGESALIPVGVHNANAFTVDGQRYVAASVANGRTILFAVEGETGQRTLREVAFVPGEHDTTVQVHPLTGQTLLYGAQAGSVFITDISDPSNPEILTTYDDPLLVAYHQVVPSDVLIEGHHFTISATETSVPGAPIKFSILDTSDPIAPTYAGEWIIPAAAAIGEEAAAGPYGFSPHNLDFDHGRIYIGHYHAGVWVIDVSSLARVQDPVTLGVYQPHRQEAFVPRTPLGANVPAVWAAIRHTDGHVYAVDINTGLYILDYTGPPSPLENATAYPTNLH